MPSDLKDLKPEKTDKLKLILISFAALFFEILVIRWVACEIRIFSYFKNFILMAAFVGLGMGCASPLQSSQKNSDLNSADKSLEPTTEPDSNKPKKSLFSGDIEFPFLLLLLAVLLCYAHKLGLDDLNFLASGDVYSWLPESASILTVSQLCTNIVCILAIFILVVTLFDELGRELGIQLRKQAALAGYQLNLFGSLLGVVSYAALSFMSTSPGVWLAVGIASIYPFYRKWWHLLSFGLCLLLTLFATSGSIWSPYYRIDLYPYGMEIPAKERVPNGPTLYRLGTNVDVNHTWFQATVNLSDKFVDKHPELRSTPWFGTYSFPYEADPHPREVLILGAGTGNDVASALRHGAGHIDAVEIDPIIQALGTIIHPERPYSNHRVSRYVDDARAFLTRCQKKYDLIIFGFVDSHTAFSTMSSVRLDNYLYTAESIAQASKHLSDDGVAALSFAAGTDWLQMRLYQIVAKSTGTQPLVLYSGFANKGSIVILWGKGLDTYRKQIEEKYKDLVVPISFLSKPVELCTDDWPFLYQHDKSLSPIYQLMLGLIVLTSALLVFSRFKLHARSLASYMQFFLLGAGFLLMETRSMLASSLLFGSTWIVNSIVIGMVLLAALASNWAVSRLSFLNRAVGYGGIFLSILALYLVPLQDLLQLDILPRLVVGILLIGAPFVFSGIIFSRTFSETKKPELALGLNILGALVGGCLEYFSMIIGSNNLLLLAVTIYILALIADRLISRSQPA